MFTFLPEATTWSLTLNALLPSIARTEGIDLRGEFTYNSSDSTTTNNTTGEALSSTFSNFRQLYNLDLSKAIYPYLTFRGGAYYDVADFTSTTGEIKAETEEKLLRPYVRLELNNPIYKAGLGYRKTSLEQSTTGIPTTKTLKDLALDDVAADLKKRGFIT